MTPLNNFLVTIFTLIDKVNVINNSAEIICIFAIDNSINAYLTEKWHSEHTKIYADLKNSNVPIGGKYKLPRSCDHLFSHLNVRLIHPKDQICDIKHSIK